jgi:hypothetical protein
VGSGVRVSVGKWWTTMIRSAERDVGSKMVQAMAAMVKKASVAIVNRLRWCRLASE